MIEHNISDYKSSCKSNFMQKSKTFAVKRMTKEAKTSILRKWRNILYYIFQLCGFLYTALIVQGNLKSYFSYKSNKVQRELEESIHKVRKFGTNSLLSVI